METLLVPWKIKIVLAIPFLQNNFTVIEYQSLPSTGLSHARVKRFLIPVEDSVVISQEDKPGMKINPG